MEHPERCRWTGTLFGVTGRTALARAGERLAEQHLAERHHLVTVAMNLRVAVEDLRGELDVVMRDPRSGLLVVCEVKSRTVSSGDRVAETLSAQQCARIRRMTSVLLAAGTLHARSVRFDLATVEVADRSHAPTATLRHLEGAW